MSIDFSLSIGCVIACLRYLPLIPRLCKRGLLNQVGFFEDFFDQKNEQMSIFWHVVNQMLSDAA